MKQKIYILGVITAMIVFTGTIFKINHYPGAAITDNRRNSFPGAAFSSACP